MWSIFMVIYLLMLFPFAASRHGTRENFIHYGIFLAVVLIPSLSFADWFWRSLGVV
ncbi:hypothetical protein [Shewanella glacialipiscicola]|uniref:hypothetical protein n=1 Tax=Shewanella glacialipiscicola TaxID=614069 RepID=UPI003D7A523C